MRRASIVSSEMTQLWVLAGAEAWIFESNKCVNAYRLLSHQCWGFWGFFCSFVVHSILRFQVLRLVFSRFEDGL